MKEWFTSRTTRTGLAKRNMPLNMDRISSCILDNPHLIGLACYLINVIVSREIAVCNQSKITEFRVLLLRCGSWRRGDLFFRYA